MQDELECSKDYKHFQFEELQSLKKKLDKESRKAEIALKDKQEGEEVIARLERELKSVRYAVVEKLLIYLIQER